MIKKKTRPSKFPLINQKQVEILARRGWTDKQMSEFFGISEQTWNVWKKEHEQFFIDLKNWKLAADELVEKSLYERALGYEYNEVTYEKLKSVPFDSPLVVTEDEIKNMKDTSVYKVKVVVKKLAGSEVAQIYWLNNRKPDEWKNRSHHAVYPGGQDDPGFRDSFFGVNLNGNGKHNGNGKAKSRIKEDAASHG